MKFQPGPTEPYVQFIDRQKEALDRAPSLDSAAKAALGKDLAFQNANTQCQQMIATLPNAATLSQIVEACARTPKLQEEKEKA